MYKSFLGKSEATLAYLGGAVVHDANRVLRVSARPAPGWWRFEISGRTAKAIGEGEAQLAGLPSVRGHLVGEWLVSSGRAIERVALLPEEQAPVLSPCAARRWHSGDLLFDEIAFEGEAEDAARRALEEGARLSVKGVSASLRAAFGIALAFKAARAAGIAVSPLEVRAHLLEISEGGMEAANLALSRLDAERAAYAMRARVSAIAGDAATRAASATEANAEERAEAALEAAGARCLGVRALGSPQIEVTFQFMGERFISVADAITLGVIDAGVCLAGADDEVTLESLPSVIREAIETEVLVITRR